MRSERTPKIMMVAGEASGDGHAAKVVREMRRLVPGVECFGSAGPQMRAEGVEAIVEAETLAIIGVPEIARALPFFWRAFRRLKRAAVDLEPDIVVLVDFPEFNLRLAKALKKNGHRVVYYISPQIWAWRSGRSRIIRDHVDNLLTILPFENAWYAERGVTNVEFVGSPLVNEVKPTVSKEAFCERHGLEGGNPIVALLPGSRQKEIETIFPVMAEAVDELSQRRPELHFVVAVAAERDREIVSRVLGGSGRDSKIIIVVGETYNALSAADAAAVTSGTATLETGILGTPMTVVYKASRINYALLRPLIKVPHFGLINLIAGDRIVTELIQNDLTGRSLSRELSRLLEPGVNKDIRAKLLEATTSLGSGGASERAAQAIVALMKAA